MVNLLANLTDFLDNFIGENFHALNKTLRFEIRSLILGTAKWKIRERKVRKFKFEKPIDEFNGVPT